MCEANNEQDWEFIDSLTNCSRLQMLSIGGNQFAGKLPSSLANLTSNLQWLRAPSNYISGVIPSEIGNLASLDNLDFDDNILTGAIPESIGKLTQLIQLYLYSNNLSGLLSNLLLPLCERAAGTCGAERALCCCTVAATGADAARLSCRTVATAGAGAKDNTAITSSHCSSMVS